MVNNNYFAETVHYGVIVLSYLVVALKSVLQRNELLFVRRSNKLILQQH
jgi:hypothetical protein